MRRTAHEQHGKVQHLAVQQRARNLTKVGVEAMTVDDEHGNVLDAELRQARELHTRAREWQALVLGIHQAHHPCSGKVVELRRAAQHLGVEQLALDRKA